MANTKIPVELSSTPGIVDNSNATAITIDSSENVGIGTTSPSQKLTVANGYGIFEGIKVGQNGTDIDSTFLGASSLLAFKINGSESMRIDSSGNVGIGNSSPTRNLTVGDTGSSSVINIKSSATNGYSTLALGDSGDDNYAQILLDNSTNKLQIQNGGGGALDNRGITLDSSENVGIGTSSPSAPLTVNTGSDGNNVYIDNNGTQLAIGSTSNVNYINTQNGSATLAIQTNGTERMRIDSSGNVGIGETSPLAPGGSGARTLTVKGTSFPQILTVATGAAANSTTWRSISRSSLEYQIQTVNDAATSEGNAYEIKRVSGSNNIDYHRWFTGASSERMRIGSDGNLLIGQTSNSITYGKLQVTGTGTEAGFGGIVRFNDPDGSVASSNVLLSLAFSGDNDATGGLLLEFRDSVHRIGSITAASGTTIAYNTSSDERLKENIVDASSQLDVINNIQVREFDWKTNGHHEVGMIAQELNDVIPNVVQEGGDDVTEQPWGVDYGKLTPYLIKAIQEQQTQIEALQSEINLLKGE